MTVPTSISETYLETGTDFETARFLIELSGRNFSARGKSGQPVEPFRVQQERDRGGLQRKREEASWERGAASGGPLATAESPERSRLTCPRCGLVLRFKARSKDPGHASRAQCYHATAKHRQKKKEKCGEVNIISEAIRKVFSAAKLESDPANFERGLDAVAHLIHESCAIERSPTVVADEWSKLGVTRVISRRRRFHAGFGPAAYDGQDAAGPHEADGAQGHSAGPAGGGGWAATNREAAALVADTDGEVTATRLDDHRSPVAALGSPWLGELGSPGESPALSTPRSE